MELEQIVPLIIDSIEMSQAISIGIFLLLINSKKKNSLWILGIFLFIAGLSSLNELLETIDAHYQLNSLFIKYLPLDFFWLLPGLFYIYTERVSVLKNRKLSYLLLIPGGVELIYEIAYIFFPESLKEEIYDSVLFHVTDVVSILFMFGLMVAMLIMLKKHSKLLKDQYSSLEQRELTWIKQLLYMLITYCLLLPLVVAFTPDFVQDLYVATYGLLSIYWIAYNGLYQESSKNLFLEELHRSQVSAYIPIETILEDEDDQGSELKSTERFVEVLEKVESIMKEKELFLNPDLTIVNIAERIQEHPRLISRSINQMREENFNSYVNRYRVEKAKELLLEGKSKHMNIEGIGLESGFKSNSTFYSAFKKCLKTTPMQFLKNQH